ncbi:hypothetical protein [Methylomonas fluvii]|nr:hypothetical protein [Methylomonas fluvii]
MARVRLHWYPDQSRQAASFYDGTANWMFGWLLRISPVRLADQSL